MPQSRGSNRLPLHQYTALTGDDIRVIKLRPGGYSDDLKAEVAHVQLRTPAAGSESPCTSLITINKSLPSGWQSFRTPEGRLFYQNLADEGSVCQYEHPSPDSVPEQLLSILKLESLHESLRAENYSENRFEALSYVWGDPTPQDALYLTDRQSTKAKGKIHITPNLSSALRHLRYERQSRLLWVDAICINQNDDAEKDRQVLRIPDVYRSAWRVIAWLGEASYDSSLAMETMQYLGEQIEVSQSTWQHPPPDAKEKDWINMEFKIPYSTQQWNALASLMERSWFKRLWVLQEITLANPNAIVQCGHNTIRYSFFRRAVVGLRFRPGAPDSLQERIEEKFTFSYGLYGTGVCDLLSMAREHACSVPHDKVYGLLGFIGSRLRRTIAPSYQKPFVETCKELFFAHSISTGRLELLAHCFNVSDGSFPSWIPDWRSYGDDAPSTPSATSLASGMSKASFREVGVGELEVSGIIHGAVTSTFKVLDSNKGDRVGPWLRKLIKRCVKSPTYPNGEDIQSAFAKLVCRNQLQERFPETSHYDTLEHWQETLDMLIARKSSKHPDDLDLEGFIRSQWGYWEWRRCFRTEHGYLGWGPICMKEGDEVCILLGLYCPLVVRPSGGGRFKIIGGCYLHGFMDSEGILGPLPDQYVVQQHNAGGRSLPRYYNENTGEASADDPRLGPLDQQWQRFERDMTADDPEHVDFFLNKSTGEEINYDPRLSRRALEQRGVRLQHITFI